MNIQISKATKDDIEFIARIILIAEGTGFEITSYSIMFGMTEDELFPVMCDLLNNDFDGHALGWKSFCIAKINDKPVGALSAYIEGEYGDSNHLMTGALMSSFKRKDIVQAFQILANHKEIQISKSKGALQLDCVATIPGYEGKGVFSSLLGFAEKKVIEDEIELIEIQVWKKNQHAINVYQSKGYTIFDSRNSKTQPDNGKVLMRKKYGKQ